MGIWQPTSICHSQGPWKNHKYVEIKNGKYYYPNGYDDGRTISDLKGSKKDVSKANAGTYRGAVNSASEKKMVKRTTAKEEKKITEKEEKQEKQEEEVKEEKKTTRSSSEEKKDSKKKSGSGSSKKKSDGEKKKKSSKSSKSSSNPNGAAAKKKRKAELKAITDYRSEEQKKAAEARKRRNKIMRREYLNHSEDRICFSDSLAHHGILGMKWGVQNGPPYPLDEKDHSAREKRMARKAARQERAEARKKKKQAKHDVKVQKKAAKEEAKRQKVLKTGNAKAVAKYKGRISNAEYDEIFKRLANEKHLDELTSSQAREIASKVNSLKNVVGGIKSTSDAAIDLYNNGADVYNTFLSSKSGKRWDKIPRKKEEDKKQKSK